MNVTQLIIIVLLALVNITPLFAQSVSETLPETMGVGIMESGKPRADKNQPANGLHTPVDDTQQLAKDLQVLYQEANQPLLDSLQDGSATTIQTNASQATPAVKTDKPAQTSNTSANSIDALINAAPDSEAVMQALGLPASPTGLSGDVRYFEGKPIAIELPVGVEVDLIFPKAVDFYRHNHLKEALVVYSVGNRVRLMASKAFKPLVNVAKEEGTETTYTFKLFTSESPSQVFSTSVSIVNRFASGQAGQAAAGESVASINPTAQVPLPSSSLSPDTGVSFYYERASKLFQYVAQQHYAPTRLLKPTPNIKALKIKRKTYPLIIYEDVIATPLAEWTDGTIFVTSFEVKNKSKKPVTLDYRSIRYGNIIGSAFVTHELYPKEAIALKAKGIEGDRSIIMIATQREFTKTVKRWEAGLDG